ncbi:MAG: methyl-accepting chemotaxis protein [Bacteroidales bacterium]
MMGKILSRFLNLPIRVKLHSSFFVLLSFMLILVYFCFSAQSVIADRIDKSNEASYIVKNVLSMRVMEQNYDARHSVEYIENINLLIKKILSYSYDLKGRLDERGDRNKVLELEGQIAAYESLFSQFVNMASMYDESYKKLKQYGVESEVLLLEIQGDFRNDTVSFLHSSNEAIVPEVDRLISRIEVANKIVNWILEAQLSEMKYFMSGDLTFRETLPNAVNNIKNSIVGLSTLLSEKKLKDVNGKLDEYSSMYYKLLDLERKEGLIKEKMMERTKMVMDIAESIQSVQKNKLQELKHKTVVKSLSLGFFAVLFSIISVWFIVKIVVPPIQSAGKLATDIADGNLERNVPLSMQSKDEVGQLMSALEKMVIGLRSIVIEIASNSRQISRSSENLLDITNKAKEGIARQDVEVEQVVIALGQMSSAIKEVVSNAERATTEAKEAQIASNTGQRLVSESRTTIFNLMEEIVQTADDVEAVREEVQSVSGVIEVIEEVAAQTNLLALNAAIEAARAGEQGRGFAVVSEEVRNLSIRTQESTESVKSLISILQEKASRAVVRIKANKIQAELAMAKGDEVVDSFKDITQSVEHLLDMNARTASASTEQSIATTRITQGIRTVKSVSERVTNGAEKTATASGELACLAQSLELLVSKFKL